MTTYVAVGFRQVTTPCQDDPDLWFSHNSLEKREAKVLCGGCHEKLTCLRQATETGETFGIWGGKDFSNDKAPAPSTVNKTCRSGKHPKDYPGSCKDCRRESQARYNQKLNIEKGPVYQNKQKHKNKKKKNEIGKLCRNNKHMLTDSNTRVRMPDKSLVCLACASKSKKRFFGQGF